MEIRAVVRRGVRIGALIGVWPAGILGCGFLVGAFVFLTGGRWGTGRALLGVGVVAALVSMAAGLVLGAATAFVLAVAPRRLITRPWPRGLLAALTAGVPLARLSQECLIGDGRSLASYPPSIHVISWAVPLVVALVMAAHSGEIAGGGAVPGDPRGSG
ncbi:hypothetical protein [Streptomyces sp. NPDC058964]|uniref:hypothetical protein n=1 Tax=Streptomyces sp. NPDC058964 TaxID=3346681 RepID=UPI0036BD4B0C